MKRFFVLAMAAVAMNLAGSCNCRKPPKKTVLRVRAEKPGIVSLEDTRAFTGIVLSDSMIQIRPKIGGRLMSIDTKVNREVKKGDILFVIESDVARQQLARARAGAAAARAQLAKARNGVRKKELEIARNSLAYAEEAFTTAQDNFNRVKNLYESGVVSRSRFEETRNRFRSAETEVENARKKVSLMVDGARTEDLNMASANYRNAVAAEKLASLQLEYTKVRAPAAGIVADIMVDAGNIVGPQVPVVLLVNTKKLKVTLALPETLVSHVHAGQVVRVSPQAFTVPKPLVSEITAVYPTVDPRSGTFKVEVPLSGDVFRPGMMIRAVVVLSSIDDAVAISWKAVLHDEDGTAYFFVLEPGDDLHTCRKVAAELGLSNETSIQIIGLDPGKMIVTDGAFLLKDGDRVELLDNAAS